MKHEYEPNSILKTRFLVDIMLGKLARWLRVLGWDAEYVKDNATAELAAMASQKGRILLTRRKIEHERMVFVEEEDLDNQLRQLEREFRVISRSRPFTRCIECNEPLERVDKADVAGKVPFYTHETQEEFYSCPGCGKVFWPGSHHRAMLEKVKKIKEKI